ncbi:protein DELAY OF GERMINATION 1-like [Andrographis paniculata]|uniref:protein DELAY OF GERMINATION 1-like n=1 Tax=Andrographis paniculata TaxID=175694 RepID=UPI0021E70464|nr:protein DELAY OF GERMINATION 1-like [Andrographis paniculata]XP_051152276.1 protein DELAY OF GERMINATION 1-like [Andrographis paniculata]
MAAGFVWGHFQLSFKNWIAQQYEDLDELLNAISPPSTITDEKLKLLGDKAIKHFEEYYENRGRMCKRDASSFLTPSWCSSLENAFMWIGGCRPSLSVRLVYSVCGSEVEDQLTGVLSGDRKSNLAEISSEQLNMINTLHCKTVLEVDELSGRLASLQEDIADEPLAIMAKRVGEIGVPSKAVDRAMDKLCASLGRLLANADRLRLRTLKDLMAILTPAQAVDLIVATKKLNLSIHEWGKRRDQLLAAPSSPS